MRRKRMPIPQREFGFSADAFNLIRETGIDGERIMREHREAEQNRELANSAQEKLFFRRNRKPALSAKVSATVQ
jgi:hypothetical protein